eukprot:TRINITY_DN6200_c0_g1_i1.p3 TRINITY_DN6200_c0_g1~~TRINITY_DN6200_c0_g1_i1.p3  ORF type:complete len:130 (+),score=10.95 TRINITY_DN6200_c0_g1_i1:183-572(+)
MALLWCVRLAVVLFMALPGSASDDTPAPPCDGDGECRACTAEEASLPVCASTGLVKEVCLNGSMTSRSCLLHAAVRPKPVGANSLLMFEAVCLALALGCGAFMQKRKRLLVIQQQQRYNRLIDRCGDAA